MNMGKAILISVAILIFPFIAASQELHYKTESDSLIDIRYISLKKSLIFPFIKKYIRQQSEKNDLFRQNYGYISLMEIKTESYSNASLNTSTADLADADHFWNTKIASFSIMLESHPFTVEYREGDCWQCFNYPLFYTMIDGRLILIYDDILENVLSLDYSVRYTQKSKEQLIRLAEPFLKKSLEPDFTFTHPLSPIKEFKKSEIERKNMTQHEIFKLAAFTLDSAREKYFVLRNLTVIPAPE